MAARCDAVVVDRHAVATAPLLLALLLRELANPLAVERVRVHVPGRC
jgi:hypothetical protein